MKLVIFGVVLTLFCQSALPAGLDGVLNALSNLGTILKAKDDEEKKQRMMQGLDPANQAAQKQIQQQAQQAYTANLNEAMRVAGENCKKEIAGDQALDHLWTKTAILGSELTFDMLADQQVATIEEKPLVREWAKRVMACQDAFMSIRKSYSFPLQIMAVNQGSDDAANTIKAQLHNGQLTWGQYNQKRKELSTAARMAAANIYTAIQQRNSDAAFKSQQLSQQAYANIIQIEQNEIEKARALDQRMNNNRFISCQTIGSSTYCN